MRNLKVLIACLLFAATATAQFTTILSTDPPASSVGTFNGKLEFLPAGGSQPANCTAGKQVWLDGSAPPRWFLCVATNTFGEIFNAGRTWGSGSRPVMANALGVSGNAVIWTAAGLGDAGAPPGTGGTGANALGSYFVGSATNAPANAINLGLLTTGLVKVSISGGVATPSTAIAADFPVLNQNTSGTAAGIAGGVAGQVPYQTGAGVTAFSTHFNYNGAGTHSVGAAGFFTGTLKLWHTDGGSLSWTPAAGGVAVQLTAPPDTTQAGPLVNSGAGTLAFIGTTGTGNYVRAASPTIAGPIFTGIVDSSGAAKTLPHRKGTGSPVGRDACAAIGETYFQSDATAGSNIFGCTATGTPGTWNLEGGGGITTMSTGTTDPVAACTAPSSSNLALYTQTTTQDLWACVATNAWKKVLSTTNTGAFTSTGTTGAAPSRPSSGGLTCYYDSTDNLNICLDSGTQVAVQVKSTGARVANQFVTYIDSHGVAQKAGIVAADLPMAAMSGVLKYTAGVPSAIGVSSTNCVHEDGSSGACVAGGSAASEKFRVCEIVIGDPDTASPVLVNGNSSPAVCGNKTGATMSITAVECYANAGTPTINPIITGGAAILTGALTCGTGTFATGTLSITSQTNGQSIDANIAVAGGTAKYIVIRITRTL